MAVATEAAVFLGTLTGILHLFRIFPAQINTKVRAHALLAGLTVLLVLVSLLAGHFASALVGLLALISAGMALFLSVAIYSNDDANKGPQLVAFYAIAQMATLVLVLGAAGLGSFR